MHRHRHKRTHTDCDNHTSMMMTRLTIIVIMMMIIVVFVVVMVMVLVNLLWWWQCWWWWYLIHLLPRLCPSTAGCSPPSMLAGLYGLLVLLSCSLMGVWPTINALAWSVVDGFFIHGVLPVVFWLTGLTHKDSGGWGFKVPLSCL